MAAWDPFSDELEDIIETVELRVRTDVTISFPALTRARSTQGKSCCRASPPPSSRSQPIPTRSRVEVSTVAASIAMELANRKDMGKEDSFTPLALAATPDVREVKPVQCVPTSTVGTGYTSYRKPSRFRRFALDTDIHGMKHLIKRGPIRRTAWVLMLLLSLGLMSFECMESLIYYFEFHHVTKVELQYTNNMTFPAVTICNMNKYRRSALGMRDLATVGPYIGIVDRQQFTLQQEHLYPKAWVDKVKNENLKALSKMTTGQQNFAVFVERVGHQKEDMIVNCEWRGSPCSAKNFTHTFTHLGNCYTFNGMTLSRKVLSSSKPGEGNGLKVTINIENDEYMATNDVAGDAMDAGIKVMVHPQHEPPFVKELGFAVSPGFHTFVAIRKEVITTLPAPYGNCQQRGGQKYYPDYSLSACRIECETEHVVHECGCRLVEMPGEHVPVCTPERYQCAYEKLVQVSDGEQCAWQCRIPCHATSYEWTLSSSKLRPKSHLSHAHIRGLNVTEEQILDNIAVLNVYYEALNYESIVQIPAIETEGLLGDLGGQMGLFLGASFLTLVEVFEYLMDELYGRVLKKCCRCKATASAHTTSPSADVLSVNINGSATQLPQTSRA
ncbi:acid-sensing ion channel 2-like isoform X1 [Branchiostoma floridae x Branchiostoma belcheri]